MKVLLSSYYPLRHTAEGKKAVQLHELKPYIDGSCRREPDFESKLPSITSLCRKEKLIGRLDEGDIVIYITNGGKGRRKLVAILEVFKIFDSHIQAATYFNSVGIVLPNNCIVDGNLCKPYNQTHGMVSCYNEWGNMDINLWDAEYKKRARDLGKFAICKVWKNELELNKPRNISNKELTKIFGRIPGTMNPPKLTDEEWGKFKTWLGK
ncbi:MAG: hypothetical protein WAV23_02855 [Minisyncoccia bacterium]